MEKFQFIPTNVTNCRLHGITSERIGNPELKAAIKCVHEYNILPGRGSGTQGAVLPSVERAEQPAGNPGPRTAKGRKHLRIHRTVRQHKGLCGGEYKQGNYLCITKWRQDYSVAFLVSNQGNFY